MNAASSSQNLAVLSAVIIQKPEELEDESTTLLQCRNSEADHQKKDGVSSGEAPYCFSNINRSCKYLDEDFPRHAVSVSLCTW